MTAMSENCLQYVQKQKPNHLTARQSFTASRHPIPDIPDFRSTSFNFRPASLSSRVQVQSQIRKRYHKMVELQHRSFLERNELEKQREQIVKKTQEQIEARTKERRGQFVNLGHSARELQFRHRCEGAELRQQRIINHRYCVQRDSNDLERKKKAVSQKQKGFRLEGPWKRQGEQEQFADLTHF